MRFAIILCVVGCTPTTELMVHRVEQYSPKPGDTMALVVERMGKPLETYSVALRFGSEAIPEMTVVWESIFGRTTGSEHVFCFVQHCEGRVVNVETETRPK